LPDNNPQTVAWNGHQDDDSQDEASAIARGKIGKHAGMITSLLRMGKSGGVYFQVLNR
jgi:hypothetical protein